MKSPVKPAAKPDVAIARELGRAYFNAIMKQTNPEMTKEEKLASWTKSKTDYVRLGRKVLNALTRHGYTIQAPRV